MSKSGKKKNRKAFFGDAVLIPTSGINVRKIPKSIRFSTGRLQRADAFSFGHVNPHGQSENTITPMNRALQSPDAALPNIQYMPYTSYSEMLVTLKNVSVLTWG